MRDDPHCSETLAGAGQRDVRLTVLVDEGLADFARAEALRDYCSVSSLLAGLLAQLRRRRQREDLAGTTYDHNGFHEAA